MVKPGVQVVLQRVQLTEIGDESRCVKLTGGQQDLDGVGMTMHAGALVPAGSPSRRCAAANESRLAMVYVI